MKCPKCNKEMKEIDGGPDGYDDDITYINDICFECEIMYHGWFNMWYNNDSDFSSYNDYEPFETPEELLKKELE